MVKKSKFRVVRNKGALPEIKYKRGKFDCSNQSVENWVINSFDPETDQDHKKYLKDSATPICFYIEFADLNLEETVELAELMLKTYKPELTKLRKKSRDK